MRIDSFLELFIARMVCDGCYSTFFLLEILTHASDAAQICMFVYLTHFTQPSNFSNKYTLNRKNDVSFVFKVGIVSLTNGTRVYGYKRGIVRKIGQQIEGNMSE